MCIDQAGFVAQAFLSAAFAGLHGARGGFGAWRLFRVFIELCSEGYPSAGGHSGDAGLQIASRAEKFKPAVELHVTHPGTA